MKRKRRVIAELDVDEDWVQSMAPEMEWLGFLAARLKRGAGGRAEVVNIYETGGTTTDDATRN